MVDEGKHGRFPPFSLRLSFDERSQLESAAGDMPLGTYIRKKLLDEKTEPRRTMKRARSPVKDDKALARLLSELGKAHLANNLNQIADRATAKLPRWADTFPYVNGGLFSGSTETPRFSKIARSYLLHVGNLDWKKINPDIFGSMIQAVADDEERGALGSGLIKALAKWDQI
jgi:hypothetical protein